MVTRLDGPRKTQGRLMVRWGFSDYEAAELPWYACAWSEPHTTEVVGVHLDDTYNRCVTGAATFTPFNGMSRVTVRIGPTSCN